MKDTSTDQPPQIQWTKSPSGVHEVYANMTHIMWSLDDLRIRVAQLVNSPTTPNPGVDFVVVAEERAAITISWRTAKLLRDYLAEVVANFEKTNGPINVNVKLPPGDAPVSPPSRIN